MAAPTVRFTDERLANGLRLIIAEDHLAPVVAVCIWYAVGSKNEVPGKTGFAHLFEHVMFQGSRHVAKTEHMGLVQAAGGTLNGTTWLDRTNYFETMPSHQLELAAVVAAAHEEVVRRPRIELDRRHLSHRQTRPDETYRSLSIRSGMDLEPCHFQ